MKNIAIRQAVALAAVSLIAVLGGCANTTTADTAGETPAVSVAVSEVSNIIDVRTNSEYADGHLKGATHLDLASGEFEKALGTLDKNAEYFVYCRSGNRSAQAVALMEQAGFNNVTDLGSMEKAAELTGIEVVVD